MATYKQPCIHCGTYIDGDALFCPVCGSKSPFGYMCPTCREPIVKVHKVCISCGRPLYVECPHCGKMTFVQDKCEMCGKSLMVVCENKRCGEEQFFQNTKCTSCGHKLPGKL